MPYPSWGIHIVLFPDVTHVLPHENWRDRSYLEAASPTENTLLQPLTLIVAPFRIGLKHFSSILVFLYQLEEKKYPIEGAQA